MNNCGNNARAAALPLWHGRQGEGWELLLALDARGLPRVPSVLPAGRGTRCPLHCPLRSGCQSLGLLYVTVVRGKLGAANFPSKDRLWREPHKAGTSCAGGPVASLPVPVIEVSRHGWCTLVPIWVYTGWRRAPRVASHDGSVGCE